MIGVKVESDMITIISLALEPCAKPTARGRLSLERKLRECKEKYGDKLYRTVSMGNVKEVKHD